MADTALNNCFAKELTSHTCKMCHILTVYDRKPCLSTEMIDGLFMRYTLYKGKTKSHCEREL